MTTGKDIESRFPNHKVTNIKEIDDPLKDLFLHTGTLETKGKILMMTRNDRLRNIKHQS